ncbi:hypothetical protein RMATCC62417_18307 [Rhizopus microsporus]|nr:hypothetical protein RMATCC62417_18307 [Rhizopus microsporus]
MSITKLIYLKHACHICQKEFKTPFSLRRHVSSLHSKSLRPKDSDGCYSLDGAIITNVKTQEAIPHYACPSCWTYHSDFEWMKKHISSHEIQNNTAGIPIETKKDTYIFRDASTPLHPPKRPKITGENISTLSPIINIVNSSNVHLSTEQKNLARQNIIDQVNMTSLKEYPTAFNMLKQALNVALEELPHFLWTYTMPNDTTDYDKTLSKIVKFVLTDFSSKCHRNPYYQPKYERTYWIDRVVPILQCFGDHSQLLGFQWCEIPLEEHAEFTIDPNSWMRTATVKYHDGLGYDLNGHGRLIMEGSSRSITKEDIEHTQGDTVKALYASIEILNSFVRRHAAASFLSLCSIVSFSLQCVCTTITLSTTSMDYNKIGGYIQTEVRYADVPNTFDSRASWMEVFELLAYMFTSLREQKKILETIKKESSGLVHVNDIDRGLHVLAEVNDLSPS